MKLTLLIWIKETLDDLRVRGESHLRSSAWKHIRVPAERITDVVASAQRHNDGGTLFRKAQYNVVPEDTQDEEEEAAAAAAQDKSAAAEDDCDGNAEVDDDHEAHLLAAEEGDEGDVDDDEPPADDEVPEGVAAPVEVPEQAVRRASQRDIAMWEMGDGIAARVRARPRSKPLAPQMTPPEAQGGSSNGGPQPERHHHTRDHHQRRT